MSGVAFSIFIFIMLAKINKITKTNEFCLGYFFKDIVKNKKIGFVSV